MEAAVLLLMMSNGTRMNVVGQHLVGLDHFINDLSITLSYQSQCTMERKCSCFSYSVKENSL